MKIGKLLAFAAVAASALAIGAGAATAQDKMFRVAMNADPDVLDMTQSTNPPQGLATMDNVYDSLDNQAPNGDVIPGLYCGGESAGGFSLHGIARCAVQGRIAAREAVKLSPLPPLKS